jgi:excisionase family DNA binding protein
MPTGPLRQRPNGRFLTLTQAAEEYGIDKQRIRKWLYEGRLRRLDSAIVGRTVHLSRPDFEKFIEDNVVNS